MDSITRVNFREFTLENVTGGGACCPRQESPMNHKQFLLHALPAAGVILIVTAMAILSITSRTAQASPTFDERGRRDLI